MKPYKWTVPAFPMITIYRLEEITGFVYFPELEDEIEDELEGDVSEGW